MGKVAITEQILDDLADAIGYKAHEPTPMTLAEMRAAVLSIPSPSGSFAIYDNGTYDVTMYEEAVVSVQGGGGGQAIYQDEDGYIVLPPGAYDGYFPQDPDGYIVLPADPWHNPVVQAKSVEYTPTQSVQQADIEPDDGYDYLTSVSVKINPIPSCYGLVTHDGSGLTIS